MKVLFIGGTGIISSACAELCLERGMDLYLLTRGISRRPVPKGAKLLRADYRSLNEAQSVLKGNTFDVIVNWIAFTEDHIEYDMNLFAGKTAQYIFISSATVYQKPPSTLPITESEIRSNIASPYPRNKIACEERLERTYREENFPMTIVRPSHTYDKTNIPLDSGYTVLHRMMTGKKIIVHGDGSSLWTMTHHKDFAKGLVGLFGRSTSLGQAYHITSDEILTWNKIAHIFAHHLGVEAKIVHVPSDIIATYDEDWGKAILFDKTHSVVFDNTKIKQAVPDFQCTIPFSVGAKEITDWYTTDKTSQVVDERLNQIMDIMIERIEWIRNNRKG